MTFEMTDQIRRHLTGDLLAWLTTVTPRGRPTPRLVWFMWTGDACFVYSRPDTAKLRHVAENDRVTVHFNSGPTGGDVVVLAGQAEVADGPPPERLPGLMDKYAQLIADTGMTPEYFTSSYTIPVRITFDRAWTVPG